jgi:hypothetical protein
MTAASLGKMPTTSLRRLISPLRRSSVRAGWCCVSWRDAEWEVHIGQDSSFGVVHQCGQLGHTRPQLIGRLSSLLARCLGIVLGEGSADPGGDDPALGLAGVRHGIAQEMNAASLPEPALEKALEDARM